MACKVVKTTAKQLNLWSAPRPEPTATLPFESLRGRRVHLIGVGGTGMSAIVRLVLHQGAIVSGCDAQPSETTIALAKDGVRISVGHTPDHIDEGTELVIVSAAIRDTNPELRRARQRRVPVLKYAQALGLLMSHRDGIAVAGSHGKTTTTSMIAYVLNHAGRDPSIVVGGMVPQLGGNVCVGMGPFVAEACEFDRSFLNLTPRVAVITNIDRDHLDYYKDLDDLVDAFGLFTERVEDGGLLVVNGDDPNALRAAKRCATAVETFGAGPACNWRCTEWSRVDGVTRFRMTHKGRSQGQFELLVPGFYNICNAMACIAVCTHFGVNRQSVREALAAFRGARRRFDRLGEVGGVMVFDDYGHHPTEVRVTLDAARQEFPTRRLWCVFQPHQYSRTRILLDDFAQSFGAADRVIVPDIYAARDSEDDRASVHSRDLVSRLQKNGVEAEYGHEFPDTIERLLSAVRSGDLVMTMGAGPVDSVGRSLLEALQKREG